MLLLAAFAFKPIRAQFDVDTTALIEGYYNSNVIFEGMVEEICYYDDDAGNIYTSNKIRISKIFKGDIQCGTINIITLGGKLNGYELRVSHQTEFNVGVAGVFMCRNTDYALPTCNIASNSQAVELTVAFQGTIEYLFDNINQEVEGFNSQFSTIEQFYDFLYANGTNVITCDNSFVSDLRNKSKIKIQPSDIVINREPTPKSEKDIEIQNKIKSEIAKNCTLNKSGETIETFISNVNFVNSGSSKYYDVEISIKSNVNTVYLGGLIFRLKYNTNTFGTNISSAATFTQSSDFPSSIYNYVSKTDYIDNILNIKILSLLTNPLRSQLSTTGKVIGTLRMPVNNCKTLANLKIDTIADYSSYTYLTINQSDLFGTFFSNYYTGSSNAGSICSPTINFLSSTSLNAGTGDILTIDGDNFGNIKGDILMRNADGTPTYLALEKYDITQWTNTQLKIRIPSIVDSSDYDNLSTIYTVHPVGSGRIQILDAYGSSSVLTDSVMIKYAVANLSQIYTNGAYAKNNQFLLSSNSDGLYHFKLHSNITNSKMIDCIKAAIRRWRCVTGVPFILDAGTVTNSTASDGVNVIKLSSIASSTNAQTYSRSSYSCSTSPSVPYPTKEIDIEINDARSEFKFDTTGNKNIETDSVDFFRTILHELGHGLCLYHTLNGDMIMYYSGRLGTFFPSNSRTIIIKNNDFSAASYVVNNSLSTPNGMSCTYNLPIVKQTAPCSWSNSVNETEEKIKSLTVYPNPFNSLLVIDFQSSNKGIGVVSVYDITGKKVYDNVDVSVNNGSNQITLSELNFNNGLYFISLIFDENTFNYKVVCTK